MTPEVLSMTAEAHSFTTCKIEDVGVPPLILSHSAG